MMQVLHTQFCVQINFLTETIIESSYLLLQTALLIFGARFFHGIDFLGISSSASLLRG